MVVIRINLFNTAAEQWFTFHTLHCPARFAVEYFSLKLLFKMFSHILNLLQWNQHSIAANLTNIFVVYWIKKKKWLPPFEFVKLRKSIKWWGKLKLIWDRSLIITWVGRQLNAGTNPIHAKARNYKTGLQRWKDMDGIVTSNGQFQLGTHLM